MNIDEKKLDEIGWRTIAKLLAIRLFQVLASTLAVIVIVSTDSGLAVLAFGALYMIWKWDLGKERE